MAAEFELGTYKFLCYVNENYITFRNRPLKTTANAPWPIKSFLLYSYSPITSITFVGLITAY